MGEKEEERHCETEIPCVRMKLIEFTSDRVEIYCPKKLKRRALEAQRAEVKFHAERSAGKHVKFGFLFLHFAVFTLLLSYRTVPQ